MRGVLWSICWSLSVDQNTLFTYSHFVLVLAFWRRSFVSQERRDEMTGRCLIQAAASFTNFTASLWACSKLDVIWTSELSLARFSIRCWIPAEKLVKAVQLEYVQTRLRPSRRTIIIQVVKLQESSLNIKIGKVSVERNRTALPGAQDELIVKPKKA